MSLDLAIATLLDTDPEFATLCDVLYGDGQDVVHDFGKADHPWMRRIGLGATLAGAALGVGELGEAANEMHEAGKLGTTGTKMLESKPAQATLKAIKPLTQTSQRKAALAGTMLGGDLIAAHGLSGSAQPNPAPQQPVGKASAVGVALHRLGKPIKAAGAKTVKTGVKGMWRGTSAVAPKPIKSGMREFEHGFVPQREPLPPKMTDPTKIEARTRTIARGQTAGKAIAKPFTLMRQHPILATAGGVGASSAYLYHRGHQPVSYSTYDPNYSPVNPVGKGFVAEGTFSKFDDDQRLAFGWASVVQKNGLPVVDRQGDYIDWQDLEDAAYRYVLKSRVGGDMHKRAGERPHHVSDLVESFVVTPEKIEKMGLPASTPVGWWVGFKVHDDDTWQEVRKGGRTGFSIHGSGKRRDVSMDELVNA